MNLEEMTLAELFEESNRVGDKYLSPEEVATREAALASARERLAKYTSVGCYPLLYLDKHDNVLCPDCANEDEYRDSLTAHVNWEDPNLYCDQCSTRIESAYAED